MNKEKDLATVRKELIQKVGFSRAIEVVVATLHFLNNNGYEVNEEKTKELQLMLSLDEESNFNEEELKELIELTKHYKSIMEG